MRALLSVLSVLFCSGDFVSAQIQREPAPDLDSYLQVTTELGAMEQIQAPRMEGTLQGMGEALPAARTGESVFKEVQQNQGRLTAIYKSWKLKAAEGVGNRNYGLILTIRASGEVAEVAVQGHSHPGFLAEVAANIKTWTFSKVENPKPFVARLRNLDFLYRKELVLE